MHHAFKLNDKEYNVELSRGPDGYRLHIEDRVVPVGWVERAKRAKPSERALGFATLNPAYGADLVVEGVLTGVLIATRGDEVFIHLDGESYQLSYEHPLERLAHQAHGTAEDGLRAPMPGSLVIVHAKPGQKVAKGEALLVMESMKMETTLTAARDGVVAQVHYAPGQTFDRDALLLSLEPVAAAHGRDGNTP
jgi:acetyl/propionyl-CoA carboxylase alpha subunit